MAKLTTLSGSPGDFELVIKTKNLQGADIEIPFTCIGRTLREWHPLAMKRMAADVNSAIDASEKLKINEGGKVERVELDDAKIQQNTDLGLQKMVEIVLEVANGWGLDDEFGEASLCDLCSKFPGVQQQLWQAYDARIRGDRLGN